MAMKANYHTHTARCGHASGTDEQYVEAAIGQHFDVLGFSDHVPWPYASGFTHRHVRMGIEQLDEYVSSMRALKRRYAGKIELLIGFECEYFPQYMGWLAEMKEEKQLDYLIFGNHYEETDEGGFYFRKGGALAPLCGQRGKGRSNGPVCLYGAPGSVHAPISGLRRKLPRGGARPVPDLQTKQPADGGQPPRQVSSG